MTGVNKNLSDYNSNILQLLHQGNGENVFHLDEIFTHVDEMIDGIADRHYLRNRLFDLCRKGRIANPIREHYSTPVSDSNTDLSLLPSWDEFVTNARIYNSNRNEFQDIDGNNWKVNDVNDSGSSAVISLINLRNEKIATITFEHFKNSLIRLNACGGRMERPDRRSSHRAAYKEFLSRLDLDEDGFTIVGSDIQRDFSENISSGGIDREDGEWNIRRRRPIFNFDFEPKITDTQERVILTQQRHLRHEDLVDFVWNDILGDKWQKKEGVYDLLCQNRRYERIIWEMKTIQRGDLIDEKRQVMKAVSQLFYYDFILGNGGVNPLIACFECKISLSNQEFLAACNILCCWKEDNQLIFSSFLPVPSEFI